MGGGGCAAHLDRGDLRRQRKEARIVQRAALVVVRAVAVGVHDCVVLPCAALEQAVAGVPVGIAFEVPPVVLPVGAVLGVDLPVARDHGEPAGVAVPVLPSVGPAAILISEHAVAVDTEAVVGAPMPHDRRHAATVSLLVDLTAAFVIAAVMREHGHSF
jgi:hypothetical protein